MASTGSVWPARLATAVAWGALAMSAVYWGLRWWGEAPGAVPPPAVKAGLNIDSTRVASALGGRDAPAAAVAAPVAGLSSRLRLLGVVADRRGAGAALLSVDGQPPQPFRVGATVVDGVRVLALGTRHVEVGDAAAPVRIALPDAQDAPGAPAARLPGGLVRP